ncbi:hypothetical protein L208DRAFT_1275577 [Tricholoma matsutake]|nr:hypothetical protein L208DRAFT_1275577 [Tricholoma matsutake 945]
MKSDNHTKQVTPHLEPSRKHVGIIWENNSCAYDAVLTILFNTWNCNPIHYTATWQLMRNTQLNILVTEFNRLIDNPQLSLDIVRESMRHHFAGLSDALFHFGHYTSVHNLFLTLLKSDYPITRTTRQCINLNHATFHESTVNSAMIRVSTQPDSYSLQTIINHFQELLPSRCQTCNQQQIRLTTVVSHPPLLAFEWHVHAPTLNNTLHITAGATYHTYHLCGIIYFSHGHFTSHIIDQDCQRWFHDGILTGVNLRKESRVTTQLPHAILAIYSY